MNNIYDDIDALITKFLVGEASPEEAIYLEEWKSSSTENKIYFEKMNKSHDLIHSTPSLAAINPQKAWNIIQSKKKVSRLHVVWPLSIAASVILVISAIFLMDYQSQGNALITKENAITSTLSDGSTVSLESKSEIHLAHDFGTSARKLTLKGKANFKVIHNEKKPFIIQTDNIFVEDLGTEFSIENYPTNDTIFVIVKEGIVRLYDTYGNELLIKAGEKAWYLKSKKMIVADLDTKIVKFDFNDTKLRDVISLLDEAFEEEIILEPNGLGKCKITTQFFDEDIETIVSILAETLDVEVEHIGNQYILKGKPCQ